MAKRFIDTNLFDDPWFMDLSASAKLIWIYSITKCNHAGIFELNEKLCVFQTGIGKTLTTVRQEIGKRWTTLDCGKIFIPRFISFQYPNGLHDNVLAQKSVINELLKYGLWDKQKQTVRQQLGNSSLTVKDKDIEQDINKDIELKEKKLTSLQILWNEKCTRLSKVVENSKDRQAKEKSRLKERNFDDWGLIFDMINDSEFCCGLVGGNRWKASYDWIMANNQNAIKVVEGNYKNDTRKQRFDEVSCRKD